jgi:ATP-dependent helicase/nuclease subunit B
VITPRRTRLVRVPDLRAARATILQLATASAPVAAPDDVLVVVPSRGAARQLGGPAIGVTRDELYDRFHARLSEAPRRLSPLERGVMAQASARAVAHTTKSTPFRLRPGLIAEMLRFYDQLRRQSQQVDRFETLILEALGGDDIDSGARRMRDQTVFLAAAFREYERRVRASGACDEHTLRERLVAERAAQPIRHVVVATADWIAEPEGLFIADFDLLSRVPALESIDLVVTETVLRSGFHERVHGWWPGIEEITADEGSSARPMLVTRPGADADELWWTHRDREEELVAVARRLQSDRRAGEHVPLDRVGVVFKTPLPYLYLAPAVFGSAAIPFRTFDTFPLAAEPTASSIDLVLELVSSGFTRDAIVALLRSPHLKCEADSEGAAASATSALDRFLSDARYLGDPTRLDALAERCPTQAAPALRIATAIARELAPLSDPAPASRHLRTLLGFWEAHLRPLSDHSPFAERDGRARAAISVTIRALADVHEAHDDPDWTIDDLALAVRGSVEEQTFEIHRPDAGIHLLDDKAARFGDFDDVTIVGLVEPDWPERPRRNIFYPPALLKSLGWPSERDRRAAADAYFLDLAAAASRRTVLSTFTLDDDALVSRSMQLDEIHRARLSTSVQSVDALARVFEDEALSIDPVALAPLDADARAWAELRLARTSAEDSSFHGTVGTDARPARPWSVSALETYLGCPFRFFARHVLALEEEPEDEEIMDPRRQGEFVHDVFEEFFDAWTQTGHGAITSANIDEARQLFGEVVDRAVQQLPPAEAALERTRLLGSPAAAGLGEAVMRMEAERAAPVTARLLEHRLEGTFTIATANGDRAVRLKGKADRVDLLADGTFRLIDYKLGWPPDRRLALQLPIYAICAEQQLAARRGGPWTLGEAAYIAFKGPRRIVPLFKNAEERDEVLTAARERLVATVDKIAAGEFPPTPDDVYRCETCSYAGVCRKDYVGDV